MTGTDYLLPYEDRQLSISINKAESKPKEFVLFFFGGSKTRAKERFFEWQDYLGHYGLSSIVFDYSGTGLSAGKFEDTSLASRIAEGLHVAQHVLKEFGPGVRLNLCGGSMGAYVALGVQNLLQNYINKLILFCPAAYSIAAHDCLFGSEFTKEIRIHDSWKKSLSFDWINKFKGDVLIITPENDEVVPKEIPLLYQLNAFMASSCKLIYLPKASHNLLSSERTNEETRQAIYLHSKDFLIGKI